MKNFEKASLVIITQDAESEVKGRLTLQNVKENATSEALKGVRDALSPLLKDTVTDAKVMETYILG